MVPLKKTRTFFCMEKGSDMVAICFAIPLPSYDMEDFVAWGMTFFFFVKSAYYVDWGHKFGGNLRRPNGQGTMQVGSVWQRIWSLDCSAKVKIFVWKTLHGTLPCGVNLSNTHFKVSPQCPACITWADTTFTRIVSVSSKYASLEGTWAG